MSESKSTSDVQWEALRANLLEPTSTSSNKKAEVLEQELSKHSSSQEWSVWQRIATLFKYSRPPEEVTKEGKTTGWKHDSDVSSGHSKTCYAPERAARSHAA